MVFLSIPVPQIDGSRFQYANCGPAVCSELISLASVDAVKLSAVRIRNASGDTSGGIEGALLARTVNQLTGYLYPFSYGSFDDWQFVRELLERRSVGIIIDAGVTVRTKYRTNSFTGNHWLTIAGGTIKDGTVKYEDPGTTYAGWQRIPLQLLREASNFGGRHWILQTPPTEDVRKNAVERAGIYAQPDGSSRRVGTLDKGEGVKVQKTVKGGAWRREDGTLGHGWHRIGRGFVKGRRLR